MRVKRLSAATIADLWLLFITVIWSGTFALIKIALETLPPFTFTALRFSLATIASLLIWGKFLLRISRRRLLQGIILGLLFGFGFYLQTFGLLFTSVGNSAFITGAMVVFTPFAYWLVERKQISIHHTISILTVFIGLSVFIRPTTRLNIGDGLTLLSALGWAFYIVYLDLFTRGIEGEAQWATTGQLVIPQFAVTALLGIAFASWMETMPPLTSLSLPTIGAILYTAFLASVIATGIQTYQQHRTTPVRAALIFSLEPVIATAFGAWLLQEAIDVWHFVGGTLVIAGVLWAETGEYWWEKVRLHKATR